MSSFSSVVQKPGKKIVPKAAPRRNVARRTGQISVPSQDTSNHEESASDLAPIQVNESAQPRQPTPPVIDLAADGVHQRNDGFQASPQPAIELVPSSSIDSGRSSSEVAVPVVTTTPALENAQQNEQPASPAKGPTPPLHADLRRSPRATRSTTIAEKQVVRSSPAIRSTTLVRDGSEGASSNVEPRSTAASSSSTEFLQEQGTVDLPEISSRPRKRRKTTPRAAPEIALSYSNSSATVSASLISPHNLASSPSDAITQNQSLNDLLKSATESAASVSELANTIDSQTRRLRSGTEESYAHETGSGPENVARGVSALSSSRSKHRRRTQTVEEQAAEIIANAMGNGTGKGRERGVTPEDAEAHELEPAKVKMGELCEDSKLGKKSTLETEMQANWAEILQRRKEDRERALSNAEKNRRKGLGQKMSLHTDLAPVIALAPAMAVVNGVIVVDQASREIDRGAQLQQVAVQDLDNVREDRDYYKYVNQGTVGMKAGHGTHSKWDDESNERFFQALRMFGTDFLMIANMFPGLTRKQIKKKFIREEKADKGRVSECLLNRAPLQLQDYAEMANKETEEFQTMESLQKELDEQERLLRAEDNERRKREGFATTDDNNTAKQTTAPGSEVPTERQTESIEPGRFDAMAREIVEAAMTPKKRQRKSNTVNSKRGPKGGRRPEAGVEEVLGSISEVAV